MFPLNQVWSGFVSLSTVLPTLLDKVVSLRRDIGACAMTCASLFLLCGVSVYPQAGVMAFEISSYKDWGIAWVLEVGCKSSEMTISVIGCPVNV